MSTEDDVARIAAVTQKLAGAQKVWVLTNAWIERRKGIQISPTVFATKELALDDFKLAMQMSLDGMYGTDAELKEAASKIVSDLERQGTYEEGDVTWSLDEVLLRAVSFDLI